MDTQDVHPQCPWFTYSDDYKGEILNIPVNWMGKHSTVPQMVHYFLAVMDYYLKERPCGVVL